MELNNSPEIPDRGETSDIPGLAWGGGGRGGRGCYKGHTSVSSFVLHGHKCIQRAWIIIKQNKHCCLACQDAISCIAVHANFCGHMKEKNINKKQLNQVTCRKRCGDTEILTIKIKAFLIHTPKHTLNELFSAALRLVMHTATLQYPGSLS